MVSRYADRSAENACKRAGLQHLDCGWPGVPDKPPAPPEVSLRGSSGAWTRGERHTLSFYAAWRAASAALWLRTMGRWRLGLRLRRRWDSGRLVCLLIALGQLFASLGVRRVRHRRPLLAGRTRRRAATRGVGPRRCPRCPSSHRRASYRDRPIEVSGDRIEGRPPDCYESSQESLQTSRRSEGRCPKRCAVKRPTSHGRRETRARRQRSGGPRFSSRPPTPLLPAAPTNVLAETSLLFPRDRDRLVLDTHPIANRNGQVVEHARRGDLAAAPYGWMTPHPSRRRSWSVLWSESGLPWRTPSLARA